MVTKPYGRRVLHAREAEVGQLHVRHLRRDGLEQHQVQGLEVASVF